MLKSLLGKKTDGTCVMNSLIQKNIDGERAYREAAELVTDNTVRDTFLMHAEQRAGYAAELATLVRSLGGEPARGSTSLAKVMIPLKMAWLKVTGAGTDRLVASAESGEDCAKNAYAKALEQDSLKGESRLVVERQMSGIQQSHARMKALKDEFSVQDAVGERPA